MLTGRVVTCQIISAYGQPGSSAVQYPPISGVSYRGQQYMQPPAQGPYYMSPGHSAFHGYSQQHQRRGAVNDQIAYQLAPPAGAHLSTTGDQYSWKIAGFSECSQSCGGGCAFLKIRPEPTYSKLPNIFS